MGGETNATHTRLTVPCSPSVVQADGKELRFNTLGQGRRYLCTSHDGGRGCVWRGDGSSYIVRFDTGVIKASVAGPGWSGAPDTNAAFSVQLETGDFSKPEISVLSPANFASAVPTASPIVL